MDRYNTNQIFIPALVRDATAHLINIWKDSDESLPQLEFTYSNQEKLSREYQFKTFLEKVNSDEQFTSNSRNTPAYHHTSFPATFRNIFKTALDFEDEQLDILLSHEYKEATRSFILCARSFDPSLTAKEIIQAGRNVWIMNGLQTMLGVPVQLTPAVFAYSMLYPYTDNFLDDARIPVEAKRLFNTRLALRLSGVSLSPANLHEHMVFKLVEMIESQYVRHDFPQVFEILIAIHQAQIKSLNLYRPDKTLSELDILRISLEKGGASVLADGYLVSGILTETQAKFLFGYGAYLQLLDDLQDVQEDYNDQIMTVFSRAVQRFPLDLPACRTYHFGEQVMSCFNCFADEQLCLMINMMNKSMTMLMIEAVGTSGKFYSIPFLQILERHSPFHFSFLNKNRHSISPYRILMKRAFDRYVGFTTKEKFLEKFITLYRHTC